MHFRAKGIAFPAMKPYHKLLLAMRLTGIILLAACLQVSAGGFSQTVTISGNNLSLNQVFQMIEKQTDYVFFFESSVLKNAKAVDLHVKNAELMGVLNACFREQPVEFRVKNKIISVVKKESVPVDHSSYIMPPSFTFKGKVVNDAGEPVPNASIQIKETGTIVSANNNGEFEITGSQNSVTLIVTCVGHDPKEILFKGAGFLTITLHQATNTLDETMIIAYGTTTKRLATESVVKIKAADIERQPVGNFLAALEGRVAGLQVSQVSGAPGKGYRVQLRGQNSINSGNDPLYLVDGVPLNPLTMDNNATAGATSSPLNSINPQDIESIEVLKDADATAIYGSRGANGVILITTKKGKAGKTHLNLNAGTGIGQVTRMGSFLNREQYLQLRHEAMSNDNVVTLPTTAYDLNGKWDSTRYTDWQNVMIGGTARYTDIQGSVSGGNETTQFLIGANYHKETTVFPGDFNDQRGSAHFNISHASGDGKLKINLSGLYSTQASYLSSADFVSFINLSPVAPSLYDSSGKLNWQNGTWSNPFANIYKYGKATTNYLNSNFSVSYDIIRHLQVKATVGYSTQDFRQIVVTPIVSLNPANNPVSSSNFGNTERKNWIVEPQLAFNTGFLKGKLNVLVGATLNSVKQRSDAYTGTGYSTDALIENLLAANAIKMTSNNYSLYKYTGLWGRLNYNWQDKYIINLTARRDGSSRFGPGKQFSNFGAAGIGWLFSNEEIIAKGIPILSYGKIRASYGITGNDQIGDYQFLDTYTPYLTTYQSISTLYPVRLLNTDYAWEKNSKFEIGLELGFLKDRILITTNYFQNHSSNQLLNYLLPSITGFNSVIQNLGAVVQNTGLEFQMNTINIKRKDFSWTTMFNLTVPQNKLIAYPGIEKSSYATRYIVGKSLFISQVYHNTGVDPTTGLYTYEDYDKDGKISSPNDTKYIVNTTQQYYGGFQNNVRYKAFQLDFTIQFVRQQYGANFLSNAALPLTTSNQLTYVLDRWQKTGQVANIQKVSNSNSLANTAFNNLKLSDRAFSDASFIRLKNVSLSYHLPSVVSRKMMLQNIQLYLQGQNLITITNFFGLDPETKTSLPPIAMFTGGIQITL